METVLIASEIDLFLGEIVLINKEEASVSFEANIRISGTRVVQPIVLLFSIQISDYETNNGHRIYDKILYALTDTLRDFSIKSDSETRHYAVDRLILDGSEKNYEKLNLQCNVVDYNKDTGLLEFHLKFLNYTEGVQIHICEFRKLSVYSWYFMNCNLEKQIANLINVTYNY